MNCDPKGPKIIYERSFTAANSGSFISASNLNRDQDLKGQNLLLEMDRWMTCDFMSFSAVFQTYQDDGRLIMKGLCNGTPFRVEKFRLEPESNSVH